MLGILSASLQGFGRRFSGVVIGQPLPAPFAPGPGAWAAYVAEYAKAFPELAGFGPFIFAVAHHNAMEAVLAALEKVDGDLSDGQSASALRSHLSSSKRRKATSGSTRTGAPSGRTTS